MVKSVPTTMLKTSTVSTTNTSTLATLKTSTSATKKEKQEHEENSGLKGMVEELTRKSLDKAEGAKIAGAGCEATRRWHQSSRT
mmetsp:Transcript_23184/g.64788  ORF Transcript_23184/g.64788 Transcript_23184/m.64788 type:complete len:84 (-) Transcript_23184:226-477(-)